MNSFWHFSVLEEAWRYSGRKLYSEDEIVWHGGLEGDNECPSRDLKLGRGFRKMLEHNDIVVIEAQHHDRGREEILECTLLMSEGEEFGNTYSWTSSIILVT
ncbi:hypothetical protein ONS95_001361 [Cadophora gregata]|uniref:uncharacterized protein n=1 Tax=Cadophora gregata TaxID=51156 RepID=UPI0026DD73F7|nr:uncharacterized protein ONS95_001361 [Cadophora gregata]KAK0110980.1 hypothetical protein ONS95_001361 [Cadophora gregata]